MARKAAESQTTATPTHRIEVAYAHPTPATDREKAILARVDLLDAKLKVATLEGDDAAAGPIRAELDALMAEWDAGRNAK